MYPIAVCQLGTSWKTIILDNDWKRRDALTYLFHGWSVRIAEMNHQGHAKLLKDLGRVTA